MPKPIPLKPQPGMKLRYTMEVGKNVLCARLETRLFRNASDEKPIAVKQRVIAHTRWN